jgi:ketosteroid isomerase-like protein
MTANPQPVRDYYDAYSRGDFDRVREVFAAECVITVPGSGLLAGSYEGPGGVDRFLATVVSNVDGGRSGFRVEDVTVGERFVIAREVTELARRGRVDEPVELPLLLRFTVSEEDGRIARLDITPEDAAAYDAFWAATPDPTSRGRSHA